MNETPLNLGNNDALLQELALRLLASSGDLLTRDPKLLVGQIPPDLPFGLPLPQGSVVLGSLLRNTEQKEIVLDISLSPEQVIDFYRAQMQRIGWHEHPLGEAEGFIGTDLPVSRALFCKGTSDPSLSVIVWKGKGTNADVRLLLSAGRHSPCAQQAVRRIYAWSGRNLMPHLDSPEGVKQIEKGGTSDRDSANSTTMLETEADFSTLTLAAHYAAQLEKAGWTRTNEGDSGPIAWHAWAFQDEEAAPWWGLFFVIKLPSIERRYFLYIEIHTSNRG
jgi:hypothetical protein